MPKQLILTPQNNYKELDRYFRESNASRIFLVCGNSIHRLKLDEYFRVLTKRTGLQVVRFSDFQPNPDYESVVKGLSQFHRECCDLIVAVGGGSAIDVAKCVKLYATLDPSKNYLSQAVIPNDIRLLVIPTTAGSGSEATRFAVIYYRGQKQSVSAVNCIPSAVLMDPSVLDELPIYQRKATMLDALCHGIESFWSVNSTQESKVYSREAIQLVMDSMDGYLRNIPDGNAGMLWAAHKAGQAINLAQTTAGHAMCYQITKLHGIAHGHAAALCISKLWPYMLSHLERCSDPRGCYYLERTLEELSAAMGVNDLREGPERFQAILDGLDLEVPVCSENDLSSLVASVNPIRLKNFPITLTTVEIKLLYQQILRERG